MWTKAQFDERWMFQLFRLACTYGRARDAITCLYQSNIFSLIMARVQMKCLSAFKLLHRTLRKTPICTCHKPCSTWASATSNGSSMLRLLFRLLLAELSAEMVSQQGCLTCTQCHQGVFGSASLSLSLSLSLSHCSSKQQQQEEEEETAKTAPNDHVQS